MDEDLPFDPEQEEVVDGLPVLAEVRAITPMPAPMLPAVQAAAAAATGFVAGAATLALLHRRSTRRIAAARPGLGSMSPAGSHRTYLVHVFSRPLE